MIPFILIDSYELSYVFLQTRVNLLVFYHVHDCLHKVFVHPRFEFEYVRFGQLSVDIIVFKQILNFVYFLIETWGFLIGLILRRVSDFWKRIIMYDLLRAE